MGRLRRKFELRQRHRRELLERLGGWSQEELATQLAEGGWTALEVMDHLIRSEQSIMRAMVAGAAAPCRIPPADRVKGAVLTRMFLTPTRVQVPAQVSFILPRNFGSMEELVARWDAVDREMDGHLELWESVPEKVGIFRHPVAGWMSASGALSFLNAHIVHHGFQVDRIQASMAR
jgi:DinB superfamily